jgi:hypothetical protein
MVLIGRHCNELGLGEYERAIVLKLVVHGVDTRYGIVVMVRRFIAFVARRLAI